MVCPTIKNSLITAVALLFLLTLKVYADSSYPPAITPEFTPESTTAGTLPEVSSGMMPLNSVESVNPAPVPATAATTAATLPAPVPGSSSSVAAGGTPDGIMVKSFRDMALFVPSLALSTKVLTVDSDWRGTVYINGGITVAPAATLTIHPGTVVRFAKGSGIQVLGRIVIKGTPENPVRLASLYRESQGSDWSGIFLSGTAKKNVFEHVVIQGADTAVFARFSSLSVDFVTIDSSASGLQLQSSTANITNTGIVGAITAISGIKSEIYMEQCSVTSGQSGMSFITSAVEAREISFKSCRLTAFTATASQLKLDRISVSGCQSAMHLTLCDGSVRESSFNNNLETGVVLNGSNLRFTGNTLVGNKVGIQVDDNLPSLWANTIAGNSSYNLMYLGDASFFVGGNVFGVESIVENDKKVFSKRPGAVQMVPLFTSEPEKTDE